MNPVASSMKSAFGTPEKADPPPPPPKDASAGDNNAGSLAENISSGLKNLTGG